MRLNIGVFALLILSAQAAAAGEAPSYPPPVTSTYSQTELLKNWALSVCLATVAKDSATRDDANATASAYLEYGQQSIEAYDQLRQLVLKYASRKYGGSVHSEFNTMKCIDLFHSAELNRLVAKWAKSKRK